ncbi:MAG: hypothetical protein AAGF76_04115 [Pseudomonadota bacterium]
MDSRSAAKSLIRAFGLGRMLLVGEEMVPVTRVLLRNGIDAVCVVTDEQAVERVSALCPGRFLLAPPDALPFEDAGFSTVIAPRALPPSLSLEACRARLTEFRRVTTRWFMLGGGLAGEGDLASRATADRLLRVNLVHSSKPLWFGRDLPVTVFERATPRQAQFDGPLSSDNLLFPARPDGEAAARLAASIGRGLHLERLGVSRVVWHDAARWRTGAVLKLFSGIASVQVCVPSEPMLQEAEAIYGSAFRDVVFTLGTPAAEAADQDPAICHVCAWSPGMVAPGDTCLLRCSGGEAAEALAWAKAQGFVLRGVLAQDQHGPQRPSQISIPRAEREIPAMLEEAAVSPELYLSLSRIDFIAPLATLPWSAFSARFGAPARRPLLQIEELERLCQAIAQRDPPTPTPSDEAYVGCVAGLAFAYGLLACASATAAMSRSASAFLDRSLAALEALPDTEETRRWRVSALRAQAVLALDRGERQEAAAFFEACLQTDNRLVRPHLRRHTLDARYFLGLLAFADGAREEAEGYWEGARGDLCAMVEDLTRQDFEQEFEYSETGNLFVAGRLCTQARQIARGAGAVDAPWPLDTGLAVAALPQSIDRYGDIDATAASLFRPVRL